MINYEEELKKFHPSLDVNEAEDAIYKRDFTDVTDAGRKKQKNIRGTRYEMYLLRDTFICN